MNAKDKEVMEARIARARDVIYTAADDYLPLRDANMIWSWIKEQKIIAPRKIYKMLVGMKDESLVGTLWDVCKAEGKFYQGKWHGSR